MKVIEIEIERNGWNPWKNPDRIGTWMGSCPSTWVAWISRVWASMAIHLPTVVPTTSKDPSGEKQADWRDSATSLLHIRERLMESHNWILLSYPADRNWFWLGWAHRAHSSSVWPSTRTLNGISKLPATMQLRVVPTRIWLPFPCDSARTFPYTWATCGNGETRISVSLASGFNVWQSPGYLGHVARSPVERIPQDQLAVLATARDDPSVLEDQEREDGSLVGVAQDFQHRRRSWNVNQATERQGERIGPWGGGFIRDGYLATRWKWIRSSLRSGRRRCRQRPNTWRIWVYPAAPGRPFSGIWSRSRRTRNRRALSRTSRRSSDPSGGTRRPPPAPTNTGQNQIPFQIKLQGFLSLRIPPAWGSLDGGGPLDATLRGFSEKDQWLRDWFFSLADIHLGFGYFRSFVAFLPIPQRQVVMHRIVDGHQESPTILQHSNMIDALESDPCQFDPAEETSAGIPEFRIRPAGSSQDQLKHIFVFFQKSISRIFFVNSGSSSTSWLKCRDSFVFFSLSFSFLPVFKFPFESIKWIRCIKLIPDVQPSVAARKQQQHQQQHQQQQQKQPELIQSCTLVTNQQWAQTLSHSSGILTNSFISNLLRGGEGEGWKGGKEELTFQEFQFVVVVSKKKCI